MLRQENFFALVAHPEDAPYIGLSLAFKLPLWSNDSALKEQAAVKVYTTLELIKILK
jgi:predicted nucleic acid-binding protein